MDEHGWDGEVCFQGASCPVRASWRAGSVLPCRWQQEAPPRNSAGNGDTECSLRRRGMEGSSDGGCGHKKQTARTTVNHQHKLRRPWASGEPAFSSVVLKEVIKEKMNRAWSKEKMSDGRRWKRQASRQKLISLKLQKKKLRQEKLKKKAQWKTAKWLWRQAHHCLL